MFSLYSNSIYCRFAPIRYEINPSFAQQTYRVRQHISNATGVYRKSRKGFISMRVILNGEHAICVCFCLYQSIGENAAIIPLKRRTKMLALAFSAVISTLSSIIESKSSLTLGTESVLYIQTPHSKLR